MRAIYWRKKLVAFYLHIPTLRPRKPVVPRTVPKELSHHERAVWANTGEVEWRDNQWKARCVLVCEAPRRPVLLYGILLGPRMKASDKIRKMLDDMSFYHGGAVFCVKREDLRALLSELDAARGATDCVCAKCGMFLPGHATGSADICTCPK